MKQLTQYFILMSIALVLSAHSVSATPCAPGTVSYKKAQIEVLRNFALQSDSILMNSTSGRISISTTNSEGTDVSPNGYKSRITLRSTYGHVTDQFGLKVRKSVYVLETNLDCNDFNILSITSEPAINIGVPDLNLGLVARAAVFAYLKDEDVVPDNRHSGDHRIQISTPKLCADGLTASVNIERSNHQSTGIMYIMTSYLINVNSGEVLEMDVRPGKALKSLCK